MRDILKHRSCSIPFSALAFIGEVQDVNDETTAGDRLPKHLLIGFALALTLYAVIFMGDQWIRKRRGAWEVRFSTNEMGEAMIIVNQPALHITNVQILLRGESLSNINSKELLFSVPQQTIPFGKIKFEDLTYLPGSVALDLFGHEIELLPRTLYLNKLEHPWVSNTNIVLTAEQKLRPEMTYDPRAKKRKRL
jgi:hypothetical protein